MAEVKVTVTDKGPYLINGPAVLVDASGKTVEGASEKMALCRCGGSFNKPFCDGTHTSNGFTG